MFNPEDFELPLEKVLKLRVINDEIDECKNIEVLQNSLKATTKLLMTYQHMMSSVLREQVNASIAQMTSIKSKEDKS